MEEIVFKNGLRGEGKTWQTKEGIMKGKGNSNRKTGKLAEYIEATNIERVVLLTEPTEQYYSLLLSVLIPVSMSI